MGGSFALRVLSWRFGFLGRTNMTPTLTILIRNSVLAILTTEMRLPYLQLMSPCCIMQKSPRMWAHLNSQLAEKLLQYIRVIQ